VKNWVIELSKGKSDWTEVSRHENNLDLDSCDVVKLFLIERGLTC
jgi:hypothetical protein